MQAMLRVFMIYLPSFILLILVSTDKDKVKTFLAITKIFCTFLSIISGIGLTLRLFASTQYLGGKWIGKLTFGPFSIYQELYGIPPFLRITSITNNPNTLALWLVFSITFCVLLYRIGKFSFKAFVFHFVLQMTCLFLTISRGGILSTLISLFLIYVMSKKQRIIYISSLLLIILVFLFSFVLEEGRSFPVGDYTQWRISIDLNSRQDAWIPLIREIIEHPLLGCGFGVSSEAILQKQQLDISAHNLYLMIFSETGLLGGSLFLLFWFLSIIRVFSLYKYAKKLSLSKQEYYSVLVCFSLQVSLLFHQFFEVKLLRLDVVHFIWMYLIAYTSELYKSKKLKEHNKSEKNQTHPPHHRPQHRRSGDDVVPVVVQNRS
ncbi:O-antigen ligase family protein [Geobacillus thermoleovorans]|nr:O-antigen ligase family protein [Geobacillus thermoleovorans]